MASSRSPSSEDKSPPAYQEKPNDSKDDFYEKHPMWKDLMKGMKCPIDDYIVRLLHASGFHNYNSLKLFDEKTDFKEIEDFVKTGDLEQRVGKDNVSLYLGQVKDASQFRFVLGEKKTIKALVEYIKTHHKEEEKDLGKSPTLYPMFKKARISRDKSVDNSNAESSSSTVVSLNVPGEVCAIQKLVKEYFIKNKFPDEYTAVVPNLIIKVKTIVRQDSFALSGKVVCPVCLAEPSNYRERKTTWCMSNFNRHMKKHKKRGHKIPGTVSSTFFGENSNGSPPVTQMLTDEETNSDENEVEPHRSNSNEEEPTQLNPPTSSAKETTQPNANVGDGGGAGVIAGGQDNTTATAHCAGDWNFLKREKLRSVKVGLISKKEKYCRLNRRRNRLGKHIEGQSRLTAYFPILNEIEMILKSNKEIIRDLEARCKELTIDGNSIPKKFELSNLLNLLMETALKNSSRKNHGQRYDDDIKLFAAYLYIIGGRMMYEFLEANLKNSLPSVGTVNLILKSSSLPIIEGMFRFQELKDFLLAHEYPLRVAVSEDGTRIQEKFCYDRPTNQIIGPVLPLGGNGVPVTGCFPATSAAFIANYFRNGKVASVGYAFIAQPLQAGASSFCLALFGTDNCFDSENVYKRWAFISEELLNIDIKVECFASDGDPKLLGAMHSLMFGKNFLKQDWNNWFFASASSHQYTVIQDAIHTANKFRSNLSPSKLFPIGDYTASQTHLRILIKTVAKEEHGITEYDLDKRDKMNFNASLKICSEQVTDHLKSVPGSKGTVAYLTVMRFVIETCLNDSLSPCERLYKIWYSAFFLRYWKLWLMNHPSYKSENFITSNLFLCVEVIAHAVTILLIKYRDEDKSEFFLMDLFSSQPCESFFRLARSLTSTFSTVINFCMKDFLAKVRLVDMLHHVTSKLSEKLVFPREKRKKLLAILTREKLESMYMPTDEEICTIASEGRKDAILCLNDLGIKYGTSTSIVRVRNYITSCRNFEDDEDLVLDQINYNSTMDEENIPLDILAAFPSPEDLSQLDLEAVPREQLSPDSSYVLVKKSSGGYTCMRKSTFCWLLVKTGAKLSNDRLEKVRQAVCFSFGDFNSHLLPVSFHPSKKSEVEIGDWCVFKQGKSLIIGQILGFSYLSGKSRSFSLTKAPTVPPKDCKNVRGLGCLCTYYNVLKDGKLRQIKVTAHTYQNIDQYVATINQPVCVNEVLALSPEALNFFKTLSV